MGILDYLLTAPLRRGPYDNLAAVFAMHAAVPFASSIERALCGGFHADRLGYAFVGGYGAALAQLVASIGGLQPPLAARVSLCATEAGGVHPRAIATRLEWRTDGWVLNGEKTFATLASVADELLVVAGTGLGDDGKNRLRVVRVKAGAAGVSITPRPDTAFTPEIPHAKVRFQDVSVTEADMLAGDGYDAILKPFRTIEDLHVLAATVGYLTGAARAHGFSQEALAECAAMAQAIMAVAARESNEPLTHVLLAGLFSSSRRLLQGLGDEWSKAPEEERRRWERDQPILRVAEQVRVKRTESAFANLIRGME